MPGPLDQEADRGVAPLIHSGLTAPIFGPDAENAINRRIFETSLDLILVVDRQGNFIRISPSLEQILGYCPEDLAGRNAGDFVHPADLDPVRAEMRAARREGGRRNFECRYVHKDGHVVTLWWTGVWSAAEEQFFFIGRDVTDRAEMERRVRENASRLALAVEISEIGLASTDPGQTAAIVNAQFNEIYGLPPDTAEVRFGDWVRQIHPEDRDRVADDMKRALRLGERYRDEFRINRRDTGAEAWVITAAQAEPGPDGGPGRVLAVSRDITRRKENERRTRADAQRHALALQISEIGLAAAESPSEPARTDAQFNRIYGQPPDATHIGAGEFLRLIHPDDRDKVAADLLEVIRTGGLYRGEFRIRRAGTGEERWVRAATQNVAGADGRPGRFVGAHLDITDLRATQQQLQQAQKMEAIGNLTGGMAHDFNNLLGIIIGNLDMLRDNAPLSGDDGELLTEALDAATRGADLIRRLLAFSRRQPLQPRQIAVNDMVSGIVGLLGRTLGENIPISLELSPDIWPVRADPAQIEASLVNLATNARDAMPGGGRLMIATANRHLDADYTACHSELAPGDYAMIEVSDTGTGIPPDVMARIFEPFFTTKEVGKGTGLGLSMVFGFVKQSGGHVNVYSEPGAGTTFRLYLPRDGQAAAETVSAAAAAPAPGAAGEGETVLVVEDNAGMRLVVRRQLVELGYQVVEADGAAAALDVLQRQKVALLFSDVIMPGDMNGIALAKKAIETWPAIKVILTSGFPDTHLGNEVANIRLLSKPYRRADLAAAVREALER
ncbi:MAG TPA: PAS domain-containing protein [Stellaceae bacterium]|nr:PAS domain-containing protein [Stellaceae bacterium]